MTCYADSSFLVSCYVLDANTPRANAWLLNRGGELIFTALHALEIKNALQLGVFRGLLTAADAKAAWGNLRSDLQHKRLSRRSVNWPVAFRIAVAIGNRLSAVLGTRSLDVLHVAAAKSFRVGDFASFDNRQRSLATAVGLRVWP